MAFKEVTGLVYECDLCGAAEMVVDDRVMRSITTEVIWTAKGKDHRVTVVACKFSHLMRAVKVAVSEYRKSLKATDSADGASAPDMADTLPGQADTVSQGTDQGDPDTGPGRKRRKSDPGE